MLLKIGCKYSTQALTNQTAGGVTFFSKPVLVSLPHLLIKYYDKD